MKLFKVMTAVAIGVFALNSYAAPLQMGAEAPEGAIACAVAPTGAKEGYRPALQSGAGHGFCVVTLCDTEAQFEAAPNAKGKCQKVLSAKWLTEAQVLQRGTEVLLFAVLNRAAPVGGAEFNIERDSSSEVDVNDYSLPAKVTFAAGKRSSNPVKVVINKPVGAVAQQLLALKIQGSNEVLNLQLGQSDVAKPTISSVVAGAVANGQSQVTVTFSRPLSVRFPTKLSLQLKKASDDSSAGAVQFTLPANQKVAVVAVPASESLKISVAVSKAFSGSQEGLITVQSQQPTLDPRVVIGNISEDNVISEQSELDNGVSVAISTEDMTGGQEIHYSVKDANDNMKVWPVNIGTTGADGSAAVSVTGIMSLTNGVYKLIIQVGAIEAEKQFQVNVADVTPPYLSNVEILNLINNKANYATIKGLNFIGQAEAGSTVFLSINDIPAGDVIVATDGTFSKTVDAWNLGVAEGSVEWSAIAYDEAGNGSSFQSGTFEYSLDPSVETINSDQVREFGNRMVYQSDEFILSGNTGAPNAQLVKVIISNAEQTYELNPESVNPETLAFDIFLMDSTMFAQGLYNVTIEVTDENGNVKQKTYMSALQIMSN